MNHPLVSICIPTYNAGEYLEDCLQSALAQTYPHLEILISDDGSADDTLRMVEKYKSQYSQIRLVKNSNPGMVTNWNNCIEQSKGEWVKFLFQDDVLKPTCVQSMVEACLQHSVDVGLCRRDFIIHDDVPKAIRFNFKYKLVRPERIFGDAVFISPESLAEGAAEHLLQNVLGEPTCYLFHKRILVQTGLFNTELKQVVDYEFVLRLGLIKGLIFLNDALALFRVHGKSESSANIKEDKATLMRQIAAVDGDSILLLHQFLYNPAFRLMKEAIGAENLEMYMKHLYYSRCKHKGASLVNKALTPIRTKYKEIGNLSYNFFKYVHYRKWFKKWNKMRYN